MIQNLSTGQEETKTLTFTDDSGQGITASLVIPTTDDSNSDSGSISVTILNDNINSRRHYVISDNLSERSATVNNCTTNTIFQRNSSIS